MDYQGFLTEVWRWTGRGRGASESMVLAAVEVIAEQLRDREAQVVAEFLPGALAARMRAVGGRVVGAPPEVDVDTQELYERVRAREGSGAALDDVVRHVHAVCRVMASELSDEAREYLHTHLPPPLARAFVPRFRPTPRERPAVIRS